MRCDQVIPYLPGFAGGELRAETARVVSDHVAGCVECAGAVQQHERVIGALGALAAREMEAPPHLLDALLAQTPEHLPRRIVPLVPLPVGEAGRLLVEHREVITSAAGTALVAAGAAYALWRAVRGGRSAGQPATS